MSQVARKELNRRAVKLTEAELKNGIKFCNSRKNVLRLIIALQLVMTMTTVITGQDYLHSSSSSKIDHAILFAECCGAGEAKESLVCLKEIANAMAC